MSIRKECDGVYFRVTYKVAAMIGGRKQGGRVAFGPLLVKGELPAFKMERMMKRLRQPFFWAHWPIRQKQERPHYQCRRKPRRNRFI